MYRDNALRVYTFLLLLSDRSLQCKKIYYELRCKTNSACFREPINVQVDFRY